MECPKCKTGWVILEGQCGAAPPNLHCIICGWREWKGFTIRKPTASERLNHGPAVQERISLGNAEKFYQREIRRASL